MKHAIFSFLLYFLCLTLQAQSFSVDKAPQPQGILLEEFTGYRCSYCPDGHAMGQLLKTILGDQLSIVAIHSGHFADSYVPSNDYRVETGTYIYHLLGVEGHGFPNGAVNRKNWNGDNNYTFGRYNWTSFARRAAAETAPVNLWAEATYEAETRQLKIEVEGYFTDSPQEAEQRLHLLLTQSHVFGLQAGADVRPYEHQHMLRDAVTPAAGDLLEGCQPQTYFSRSYTYQVPELYGAIPAVAEDLELVVFVTGADEKDVRQVITVKPAYQGVTLPLKAVLQTTPMGITDGYSFPYFPVMLENRSNQTVTSAKFSVTLNDETLEREWQGEIPAFGRQEIRIPVAWEEPLREQNVWFVTLEEMNGQSVDPSVLSSTFGYTPLTLPAVLTMKHYTTNHAQDNVYTLYDIDGGTAQTFGPYENERYYEEKLQPRPAHRYCLEVTSRWAEGYMPIQNFLELCDAEGTPLAVRDRITGFGFRIFFNTEGELEPPVETRELSVKAKPYGIVRVNDVELRDETRSFTFDKGETVRISAEPDARYHVESFLVNGMDLLDQTDCYVYSFELNEDTDIAVSFDYFHDTGVDQAEQPNSRVYAEAGRIVLTELECGQSVSVYTADGKLIYTFTAQSPTLHLNLPKGQAYVVLTNGKSYKVML